MEDDQQFCLRWNNHQSTLVAVFDTLLENGTLVDCTLAAEGKYLNAHKVVLSACSPYFESLLSQNYDKHPIFILKDVKYQELKAMMDYMYRGEVNISQDQLGALLKAAESLQIKGLSDNRKGETETRKTAAPPPPPAKSPPPAAATSIPRVQGLTIEQRRREMEESREGSQSPGARKKKRIRRRSLDDLVDNHHDASNSSESHHSSQAPAQNIPTTLPAAPVKIVTDVPEPIETKADILTRHKSTTESEVPQVPIIKEKLETHSELMLEPKAEYIDEMNEDSIEDLTLDDDDISNMEQMDDQGAGPSHGNMGEGSGQGFGGWHMGNQSQDEVFLAAQEAVGAHRDSQGVVDETMADSDREAEGSCHNSDDANSGLSSTSTFTNRSNLNPSGILKEILRNQVEMKYSLNNLSKRIDQMENLPKFSQSIHTVDVATVEESPIISKLPCGSVMDMLTLDNLILEKENFKNLVNLLYLVGGETEGKTIYYILRKLMTNEVALLYSGIGKKGKLAFCKLNIYKAVIAATRKRHTKITDEYIRKTVSQFLAQSKSRVANNK